MPNFSCDSGDLEALALHAFAPVFVACWDLGMEMNPQKLTWNLEMMVSNRNLQTSKGPPFSGSMFVLGGVCFFGNWGHA